MQEYSEWIKESADSACELALSEPAKRISKLNLSSSTAEQGEAAAQAYIELARALKAPEELWVINQKNGYPDQRHVESETYYAGALGYLLSAPSTPGSHAAALALIKAGACVWTDAMHGSLKARFWTRLQTIRPKEMAKLSFRLLGRGANLASHALLLKRALSHPPAYAEIHPDMGVFIEGIREAYDEAAAQSGQKTVGVLGPSDNCLKEATSLVLQSRDELVAASEKEGAALAAMVKEMIKDAEERFALKSRPVDPRVDPAALIKGLCERDKGRLIALMGLIEACPNDADFIKGAFDASGCLNESPQRASVSLRGDGSLFRKAMSCASFAAVDELARRGANIWLASAQDGYSDAVWWALAWRYDTEWAEGTRSGLARALVDGAWVMGEGDPLEYCARLCEGVIDRMTRRGSAEGVVAARDLAREFEKMELDRSLAAAAAPARRAAL